MKLSRTKHLNIEGIPKRDDGFTSGQDEGKSSASKLRTLLDKRKSSMNILPDEAQSHDDLNMPVEDMANLLHECDASKRHLEEQIGFYQDSLAGLRLRTEQVVSENEMLYERLKESFLADTSARKSFTVKFDQNEDKKYIYQLEKELDEVKNLNQTKTFRLETIIKSTREELEMYREKVSKLQSQLRVMNSDSEQEKRDNVCMKCGGLSYFSSKPSLAHIATLDKLSRERDELTETLTKQKSLMEQCQQREFKAYMEVKKNTEVAENAKLEKAEAIIMVKQLESSLEEEKKRHEAFVSSTNENWKRECDNVKFEKFEKEKQALQDKIESLTQASDKNNLQLEKITREKVNLISDLEKSKAELAACRVENDKVKQDTKNEVLVITRQRIEIQQELENIKNIQARELKEHEQLKMSLTSVNEELRRRLTEAQSSLLETREENLKKVGEFKQLENELHLLTLSKANLETAHEENQKYFKKQDEQREQQFIDTLKENEKKYAELRSELEKMLQAQMKMSSAMKEENKRLILKMEERKENQRSEKTKWQDQLNELASELEFSRKENNDRKAEKQNLSQMNDELAGKVKFLKQENKKGRKMIYNLLKKQKELMEDRQTLCHELDSFQRSLMAGAPLQRYSSQEAGHFSANEQGSGADTSFNVKQSNVEINNDEEGSL